MSKAWSSGLAFVMLAMLVVVMTGCEGEQGPAGASGTAECMNCHTDDYAAAAFLLPYETEYAVSLHATTDTFLRREGEASGCSKCHTNEGFQHFIATGEQIDIHNSTNVGCFTCHAPHTNMDFTLRHEGPTTLLASGATYDKGKSNLCAVCHQPRAASPAPADGAVVTSTRWGPHHGTQSSVLSGAGAYQLPGETFATTHSHATLENGCINCHMAALPAEALGGGHTFEVRYDETAINSAGCVECHSGDFTDDDGATTYVDAFQASFAADLDVLRQDMRTLGWLNASSDRIIAQTFAEGDDMGAILNFLILVEDKSLGVHNPTFARDLLDDTQAYVDTRMP